MYRQSGEQAQRIATAHCQSPAHRRHSLPMVTTYNTELGRRLDPLVLRPLVTKLKRLNQLGQLEATFTIPETITMPVRSSMHVQPFKE